MLEKERKAFFEAYSNRNSIYDENVWKEKFPEYVYRYRPLGEVLEKNKNEFEALKENKLWGSVAATFEDLNEFAIKVTYSLLEEDVDIIFKLIAKKSSKGNKFRLTEEEKKMLDFNSDEIEELINKLKQVYNINRDNFLINREAIKDSIRSWKNDFTAAKELKNKLMVICFTEEANSEYMWKNYANDFQGFIVRYRFEDMIKANFHLLPVIYVDKEEILDIGKDSHKSVLIKYKKDPENESIVYENEVEWRRIEMFKNDNVNKKNGELFEAPAPDAIFFGKNMSNENKKILEQICHEKDIKCGEF